MRLEQFKMKPSLMAGFINEGTVVTNGEDKVMLLEKAKTWVIRKFKNKQIVFELPVLKSNPEELNKQLKNISKR